MPRTTPARELFDRLLGLDNGGRYALVKAMTDKANPQFENDYLEFKRPPQGGLADPDWPKLWQKALCGFANADGGVLIWGVKATQNPATRVNAAETLVLVENPLAVKSRLVQLQSDATNPTVGNVEILPIDSPETPGRGLVVCHVPGGEFKPCCTREHGRDARYFIRVGESTLPMPRHLLQSMFYPKSSAAFRAHLTVGFAPSQEQNERGRPAYVRLSLVMTLTNIGTATAKDVHLLVNSTLPNFAGCSVGANTDFHGYDNNTVPRRFISKFPLHPGPTVGVCPMSWSVPNRTVGEALETQGLICVVEVAVHCNNHAGQYLRAEFEFVELECHSQLSGVLHSSDDKPVRLSAGTLEFGQQH